MQNDILDPLRIERTPIIFSFHNGHRFRNGHAITKNPMCKQLTATHGIVCQKANPYFQPKGWPLNGSFAIG